VGNVLLVLLGAALLLATPWLMRAVVGVDRILIIRLIGPASLTERVRDLEQARAYAVDDAVARLRRIERDLHDGAQAQLVAVTMKLGLAREDLGDTVGATAESQASLRRALELVDAAHGIAREAITELRDLAHGIHPPALDHGLDTALATLAARSAVPVTLVAGLPERPSAGIEIIAYFCVAELLASGRQRRDRRQRQRELLPVAGDVVADQRSWNDTYNPAVQAYFGLTTPNPAASNGGLSEFFSRPRYQDSVKSMVGTRRAGPSASAPARRPPSSPRSSRWPTRWPGTRSG
jgi:hypothetical protein